jgi:hypothetical protein
MALTSTEPRETGGSIVRVAEQAEAPGAAVRARKDAGAAVRGEAPGGRRR